MALRFIALEPITGKRQGRLYTAEEAVEGQCNEEASHRDGELERMRARCEALEGIVGRLVEYIGEHTHNQASRAKLAEVIGWRWETAEGDC